MNARMKSLRVCSPRGEAWTPLYRVRGQFTYREMGSPNPGGREPEGGRK